MALLAYSTHHRSPTVPNLSEWDACQRPLGAWNAIWVVREGFTCILAYWQWTRERQVRLVYACPSSLGCSGLICSIARNEDARLILKPSRALTNQPPPNQWSSLTSTLETPLAPHIQLNIHPIHRIGTGNNPLRKSSWHSCQEQQCIIGSLCRSLY